MLVGAAAAYQVSVHCYVKERDIEYWKEKKLWTVATGVLPCDATQKKNAPRLPADGHSETNREHPITSVEIVGSGYCEKFSSLGKNNFTTSD